MICEQYLSFTNKINEIKLQIGHVTSDPFSTLDASALLNNFQALSLCTLERTQLTN